MLTLCSTLHTSAADADGLSACGEILAQLRTRSSEKWRRHGPEVLPSHLADMDFPVAPEIRVAVESLVANSDMGYAFSFTSESAAQSALSNWLLARYGWYVPPDDVLFYADVMRVMEAGIEAFSLPGDAVVTDVPAYPPFFSAISERGREPVGVPLIPRGGRWQPDLAGLERAFRAGAKVYLLCNPHNPTGLLYSAAELTAIAALAAAHDVTVLCDEVHSPLVYPGLSHVPLASLPAARRVRCLTAVSASKGWNISGLKCAFGVPTGEGVGESLLGQSNRLRDGVGILGVAGAIAAFADGDTWLAEVMGRLDRNRRLLAELLREHGLGLLGYRPPDATYLAWLDCRRLIDKTGDDDVAGRILRRGGLAVSDGRDYGSAGFLRINLAMPAALLEESVRRLARGLDPAAEDAEAGEGVRDQESARLTRIG